MRSREDRPFTCKFGAPLAWLRRQTCSSPPPWSVERSDACFIVRDHGGQALAYVYFEEEPGRRSAAHLLTRDEARRIAANIAKLPKMLSRA
jgi:hypothetical protein